MLGLLKKLMTDINTLQDGVTFDVVSFEGNLAFFLGMVMYIISQVKHNWLPHFNLMEYSLAIGALITATAVTQRVRPDATKVPEREEK